MLHYNYDKQRWQFGFRVKEPVSKKQTVKEPIPRSPELINPRHTIPYTCATYACVGMDTWITYCEVVFDHGPEDVVRAVPSLIAHSEPESITCPKCRKAMGLA